MAFEEKENLEESQTEGEENLDPDLEEQTESADESEEVESESEETEAESPTAKYDSRLAALEAQLTRANEDRDTLRETLRLNQQLVENTRPVKATKQLSDEQKALKDLGLAFGDDIQGAMEPLMGTVTKLYDSNDAVSFQLQISRSNPAMMEGEAFDKLSQTVEQVRQQYARSTGQYLPRMDAYKYAKGAGMLDNIVTPVTKKVINGAELKRQSEVRAAGTIKSSPRRVDAGSDSAEIQKIREKAQRGARLSPKEREAFREYLGNKVF